jgi:hypothetical protein
MRPTMARITLDMGFDSGSLDLAASEVDGDRIRLVGRDVGLKPGRWKWIHFRARGVRGRTPELALAGRFAAGRRRLARHRMVHSPDGRRWAFFDAHALDGDGTLRFGNRAPFACDAVFVAYAIPHPLSRVRALVEAARASPYATPTDSGDAAFAIGRSAGGVDDLGRRVGPHPLHGFVVRDPRLRGRKARVVLCGGVHPNETTGSFVLDGLVRWLLGQDAAAAALRREAEVFVYPMVNPDGRWAGYNRTTVGAPHADPNRGWTPEAWDALPEVRRVAQAMARDTGGAVRCFLDFHGAAGADPHHAFLDVDGAFSGRDMRRDPFWRALRARDPLVPRRATYRDRTAARWGVTALDATFAATVEACVHPGAGAARYRGLGEAIGRALADALAG